MKYLVNTQTKEHIRYNDDKMSPVGIWKIVEADADGWIHWNGGECPLPDGHPYNFATLCLPEKDIDDVYSSPEENNWDGSSGVTFYRPILAEKEAPKHFKACGAHMKASAAYIVSENVFDRLRQATESAESIPAILAEINALLPDGYCVTKREAEKPAEKPAEDMTDWRNWKEGDLVTVHGKKGHYSNEDYKDGKPCRIVESCALGLEIESERHDSLFFADYEIDEGQLRFHSRPVKS